MPAYDDKGFAPAAPVARVILRHPDSGEGLADIPMLIDSGADATLLPRSAVASLGIRGTGERYDLVAFDGTINESEAVRAVIVFLDKTFSGRFLQVESEVGIIGRNVLNRVRLLLDGPALNWEETPPTSGTA
jgi:hypothetical protein